MSSRVVNFVAGGGKTTYSRDYMINNKGGLYLAFTNSVVNEMKNSGILSLTISSLFSSFILPKMLSYIPIVAKGSSIIYNDKTSPNGQMLGSIKISNDGKLYNGSRLIPVSLETQNQDLHSRHNFTNGYFLKLIFATDSVLLDHEQRDSLAWYIVKNYPEKIVAMLSSRFEYIIIDEAQDIKSGFMQDFAELLFNSDVELILLGDPYQNVNGGSDWFEGLDLTEERRSVTYRCPEDNCVWIRENLEIDIYGNDNSGGCIKISDNDLGGYDDGSRVLLYSQESPSMKDAITRWSGPKQTIKSAKGSTIEFDAVIFGKSMNIRNLYTAITRTTKCAYYTVERINK